MKVILTLILASIFLVISCEDPNLAQAPVANFTTGDEVFFQSTIIGIVDLPTETVELENTGSGTLKIESAQLASNTGEYDISDLTDQLPISLTNGEKVTFDIKFSPKFIRMTHKNKLKFTGSEVLKDKELIIDAPQNMPEIKLSPKSLTFSNSNVQSFDIINIGTSILTIEQDVRISNPNFTFNEGFTIPAGTKICPNQAKENNLSCKDGDTIIPKKINVTVNYSGNPGSTDEGNVIIYNDGQENEDVSFVYLTAATNVCHLYVTNIEDNGIDFGSVFISSTASKNIALINTGGADCTINSLTVESNEGVFVASYLDNYPEITDSIVIPSRSNATTDNPNQYIFKIGFSPTNETSYTGNLKIVGSDPLWEDSKIDIPLIGTGTRATLPVAKCDIEINGNSIGDYAEVEPAIDGGTNPPSIITLNGSESFDPNGETLTYLWEKVSSPPGSVATPRTPTAARSNYFVDLSGEHKLKLTVKNESGLTASCEVTANGITSNALHIELFWDKKGDVDLHLKHFGTNDSAWGTANDCHWRNCKNGLEWGAPGEINNPALDRDDIIEKGPENINIDTPETTPDGQYYSVGVKNFSHSDNPTATVRIYCNGGAQFEYSMSLPVSGSSFWWVAGVEWTANGCNISPINTVGTYNGEAGSR